MGKGSKSGACKSATHQLFKDRAKTRVDDLQGMFSTLQSARNESRSSDVALLEAQVHQMLREWKSELNQPSPASSLQQEGSLGSDINRLLQHCEEADDASSPLAALKPEPDTQKVADGSILQEGLNMSKGPEQHGLEMVDQCKNAAYGLNNNMAINSMNLESFMDQNLFDFNQVFEPQYYPEFDATGYVAEDGMHQNLDYQQSIFPPPPAAAFLGPKCALWDCPRPALGVDWSMKAIDYCSPHHSTLAPSEGYPGSRPIVRPGGIFLKDNLLFAALGAKALGKEVGIPECEGAATTKSPWNANELFDYAILDRESMREWLFFDKPRRAFESGNRKQRSLPDYIGRGWHESRKQVVNEFGGLKRSYYMDPQPMENYEWHLYEYEINKYDTCALYRLEFKRVEGKKASKGKLSNDSVADLQKQMRRLTAEFPNEKPRQVKGRGKASTTKSGAETVCPSSNAMESPGEGYGRGEPLDYLVDDIDGYYK